MEGKPLDQFIHLSCDSCGQHIRVPKSLSGKTGKCPKCQKSFTISQTSILNDEPIRLKRDDIPSVSLRPLMETGDEPVKKQIESQPPKPNPSFFIYMLTFPLGLSGILHFLIFWLVPFVFAFFYEWDTEVCCFFYMFGRIIIPAVFILFFVYFFNYMTNCILYAADDERFAPRFSIQEFPSMGDLFRRGLLFAAGLLLCFGPAFLCVMFSNRVYGYERNFLSNPAFLLFLCLGIFLLPMILLSITMIDSIKSLKPSIIINSIMRTIPQYILLFLLFNLIAVIMFLVIVRMENVILSLFAYGIAVYLFFIAAFALGRFYRINEDKLNW